MLELFDTLCDVAQGDTEDFGDVLRHPRGLVALQRLPQTGSQHRIPLGLATTNGGGGELCVEFLHLLNHGVGDAGVARTHLEAIEHVPQRAFTIWHQVPLVVARDAAHLMILSMFQDHRAEAAFGHQVIDGEATAGGVGTATTVAVVGREPTILCRPFQRNIHDGAAARTDDFAADGFYGAVVFTGDAGVGGLLVGGAFVFFGGDDRIKQVKVICAAGWRGLLRDTWPQFGHLVLCSGIRDGRVSNFVV